MRVVEEALESTNGYIKSFERNTVKGWWEIQIGLPVSWVYDENSEIGCEVIAENEIGKLIKVFPKKNIVVIDDLIDFVEIVINTNKKIAVKEQEFKDKMQEMKSMLEEQAKSFYLELDELKEKSFKGANSDFEKNLNKPKRGRPAKKDKPQPPKPPKARIIKEGEQPEPPKED